MKKNLIYMNALLNNTCNDIMLEKHFKTIICNPPFSEDWNAKNLLNDERFDGKLAPKSKADFAFTQHMIYQLDNKSATHSGVKSCFLFFLSACSS